MAIRAAISLGATSIASGLEAQINLCTPSSQPFAVFSFDSHSNNTKSNISLTCMGTAASWGLSYTDARHTMIFSQGRLRGS